eukprot:2407565-Amphidinium_carterae.1
MASASQQKVMPVQASSHPALSPPTCAANSYSASPKPTNYMASSAVRQCSTAWPEVQSQTPRRVAADAMTPREPVVTSGGINRGTNRAHSPAPAASAAPSDVL